MYNRPKSIPSVPGIWKEISKATHEVANKFYNIASKIDPDEEAHPNNPKFLAKKDLEAAKEWGRVGEKMYLDKNLIGQPSKKISSRFAGENEDSSAEDSEDSADEVVIVNENEDEKIARRMQEEARDAKDFKNFIQDKIKQTLITNEKVAECIWYEGGQAGFFSAAQRVVGQQIVAYQDEAHYTDFNGVKLENPKYTLTRDRENNELYFIEQFEIHGENVVIAKVALISKITTAENNKIIFQPCLLDVSDVANSDLANNFMLKIFPNSKGKNFQHSESGQNIPEDVLNYLPKEKENEDKKNWVDRTDEARNPSFTEADLSPQGKAVLENLKKDFIPKVEEKVRICLTDPEILKMAIIKQAKVSIKVEEGINQDLIAAVESSGGEKIDISKILESLDKDFSATNPNGYSVDHARIGVTYKMFNYKDDEIPQKVSERIIDDAVANHVVGLYKEQSMSLMLDYVTQTSSVKTNMSNDDNIKQNNELTFLNEKKEELEGEVYKAVGAILKSHSFKDQALKNQAIKAAEKNAIAKETLKILQDDIENSKLLSPISKETSFFAGPRIFFKEPMSKTKPQTAGYVKKIEQTFVVPAHLKKMLDAIDKAVDSEKKNDYRFDKALYEVVEIAAQASKNKPRIGKRESDTQYFYERGIFDLLGIDVAGTLKNICAYINGMTKKSWGTLLDDRPTTVNKIYNIINDKNTKSPYQRLIEVVNLAREASKMNDQAITIIRRSKATRDFYDNFLPSFLVVDKTAPHRKEAQNNIWNPSHRTARNTMQGLGTKKKDETTDSEDGAGLFPPRQKNKH